MAAPGLALQLAPSSVISRQREADPSARSIVLQVVAQGGIADPGVVIGVVLGPAQIHRQAQAWGIGLHRRRRHLHAAQGAGVADLAIMEAAFLAGHRPAQGLEGGALVHRRQRRAVRPLDRIGRRGGEGIEIRLLQLLPGGADAAAVAVGDLGPGAVGMGHHQGQAAVVGLGHPTPRGVDLGGIKPALIGWRAWIGRRRVKIGAIIAREGSQQIGRAGAGQLGAIGVQRPKRSEIPGRGVGQGRRHAPGVDILIAGGHVGRRRLGRLLGAQALAGHQLAGDQLGAVDARLGQVLGARQGLDAGQERGQGRLDRIWQDLALGLVHRLLQGRIVQRRNEAA